MKQQSEEDVGSVNIVDAALVKHIASRTPNQTSHTQWKTFTKGRFRCSCAPISFGVGLHRGQISRTLFDQVKGCASFVDSDLAEAQRHMDKLTPTRDFHRMMGTERWNTWRRVTREMANPCWVILRMRGSNLVQYDGYLQRIGFGIIPSCSWSCS